MFALNLHSFPQGGGSDLAGGDLAGHLLHDPFDRGHRDAARLGETTQGLGWGRDL